jgi:hypothetical protein
VFEAGRFAALQRNLKVPFSDWSPLPQASAIDDGNEGIETSNRLGRAPPLVSLDLNYDRVFVSAIG